LIGDKEKCLARKERWTEGYKGGKNSNLTGLTCFFVLTVKIIGELSLDQNKERKDRKEKRYAGSLTSATYCKTSETGGGRMGGYVCSDFLTT